MTDSEVVVLEIEARPRIVVTAHEGGGVEVVVDDGGTEGPASIWLQKCDVEPVARALLATLIPPR
jgi:hypothetical protein